MPISHDSARRFAEGWFGSWNRHDLPAILACYDPAIEHSSPFIKRYNEAVGRGDDPLIRGLADLGAYFGRALERNPSLRYEPVSLAVGLESIILVYRRHSHDTPPEGDLAAEVFFLRDTPSGAKAVRTVSHYA